MQSSIGEKFSRIVKDSPLAWAIGAFFLYWYYAQFILTVAWNAIELIIAQHLIGYGAYVTSLDYQSAITWRPLVPTLIVTFFRVFTADPMEIYRLICGLALAGLTASLFLSAKRLWGLGAAHAAAFLTVVCPAMTTSLINQAHSYSHLGTLLVFGPTLLFSLQLFKITERAQLRTKAYALVGALWGLSYLCRAELILFFALYLLALAILLFKKSLPLKFLLSAIIPFAVIFASFNLYADHVARRDGIAIRKPIYGMYMSQGWADPPADIGPDIEGDGYVYALKLYGDPVKNHESMLRAISNNPRAFEHRVRRNLGNFYRRFWDRAFFPPLFSILALTGLCIFFATLKHTAMEEQLPVWFLLSAFLATHFVLIFHIDERYLTIAIPPLILLGAYSVHRLLGLPPAFVRCVVIFLIVGGSQLAIRQYRALGAHGPLNEKSILAMKALGEHFQSVGAHRPTTHNLEPHISFVFPAHSPLFPEDQFLLAYFSETSWVNGGAEGIFPRGKFYSYRNSPMDYVYLPEEKVGDPESTRGLTLVSDCLNPVLGRYFLYRPSKVR